MTEHIKVVEDVSRDFHGLNASKFFGVNYDNIVSSVYDESQRIWLHKTLDKALRDLSNRVNHDALYNMGAAIQPFQPNVQCQTPYNPGGAMLPFPKLSVVTNVESGWDDFVHEFMRMTEGSLSPEIFRKWSAISLLAGAMERRVWAKVGPRLTFPNLYTLLVAPPGVGKLIIDDVRELWREARKPGTDIPAFVVGPDSVTKASLMDNLAKAARVIASTSGGKPETHSSLLVAAEEFGVLMPAYDLEFIAALNGIYNNKVIHEESRRASIVKELKIPFPVLNILGGTQPGWLSSVFPEEAWSTGLTSRLLMIYCSDVPLKDIFDDPGTPAESRKNIISVLGKISSLHGQMQWEEEAATKLRIWHLAGGPPAPTHSKLENYIRRRSMHLIKLSTVSAISRGPEMVIRKSDVERAMGWLFEAERFMPDIFRAMVGKSDVQVIEELHGYMMTIWAKTHKSMPVSALWNFLKARVPGDKIDKIIMVAEKSNVIARVAGENNYIPRPKHEFGIE